MILDKYIEDLANNKEIYLRVRVSPGAGRTDFLELMTDGTIKIALNAQPEKGKANQELIKFLALEMGVRKYQVKIISGAGERLKLVKVSR
ncbi:TPA: hypothetical protein DCZ15_00525 [Candidatus Falkowbacteria bacterium]|jgi:uncharacterized protein (TIGR00251 family)|nr:MAG: hypothetical protein UV95_C0004G0085 [Candidatus Falkowbacteria bacterium GW2011_GWF2_43_32]HBA36338.1 hypothetical protein [Candidatus Falkowbacteria bacterium]